MIRDFVSDQEMFEYIEQQYEDNKSGKPMFLFGVTMQNHGSYDYTGDAYTPAMALKGYSKEYTDVEQYLGLIHETDSALEQLINYFQDTDEKVEIVFFGDHLPNLDEDFYSEVSGGTAESLDEMENYYKVPFFIWCNYDIEEEYVELTSLNYLSNYMYQAAQIELPAYNQFLSDVQEVIPAMNAYGYYSASQGKFLTYDEAEGKEADFIEQYRILEYNSIFDEDRSAIFFK
jgi:phosphoglycerol transferase MdoB-like AlkP superfamily enzyme